MPGTSDITVSNLAITPGFGQNFAKFTFSDPNYNGLSYLQLLHIELWSHTSNNRGDDDGDGIPANATKAAEGINETYHVTGSGAARWYWARAVDNAGNHGAWYPASKTAGVPSLRTAQIGNPGYLRLPSGLIVQWGSQNSPDVTFPIEFPNGIFSISITPQYGGSSTVCTVANHSNIALTGFTASLYTITNGGSVVETPFSGLYFSYIAIGY